MNWTSPPSTTPPSSTAVPPVTNRPSTTLSPPQIPTHLQLSMRFLKYFSSPHLKVADANLGLVPDGVEEVELAKIDLEQKERYQRLICADIRKLSLYCDILGDQSLKNEGDLWMIHGEKSILVQGLKRELVTAQKSRKESSAELRVALQKAAQLRLMEKEKKKSPSYAMHISLQIRKVVWSMLLDGKSFAEAEINDMIYDFDQDYKDVGVSLFTTKYFVVQNCLPITKSDMLLSAWNPPPEWYAHYVLTDPPQKRATMTRREALLLRTRKILRE